MNFTGNTNAVAGYLTQGPNNKPAEVLTSPPPIDRNDPLTGYNIPTE